MRAFALSIGIALSGCQGAPQTATPTAPYVEPLSPSNVRPGDALLRRGDEIMVCGQLFHTGTRVIQWHDRDGYDAYRVRRRFPNPKAEEPEVDKARYNPRKVDEPLATKVAERGWTLADLRGVVDQFVLHFDVAGTARQCFKVLERRDLSVHFLLDIDGTIYQTLDLKERAWHATKANTRAIGIEIAHIGAYPSPGHPILRQWYDEDDEGVRITLPKWLEGGGVRTPGFVGRPARPELITGTIRDKTLYQYDFTSEQYRALTHLVATLHRVFPSITIDAPRGGDGEVLMRTLTATEFDGFQGVLGHYHVQKNKTDPGPAFDWERVLGGARILLQ